MTIRDKATGKSERLAVLNSAEQEALYALPDFDDAQRLKFLALNKSELALACSRRGFTRKCIASFRTLTLKPSPCFSVSDKMMFRTTAALS